jgi:hypothetical protein
MSPSKAFWQAVATVLLPSLLFWTVAGIVLRETFDSDVLLLYLIFFALPLPLIYPIYRRYRAGIRLGGVARSPRYYFAAAVSCLLLSGVYVAEGFSRHRRPGELFFPLAMAACWIGLAGNHFYRAIKAKTATPPLEL